MEKKKNIFDIYMENGCQVPFFVSRWHNNPNMVIKVIRVEPNEGNNYGSAFGHFTMPFKNWRIYAKKSIYLEYNKDWRQFEINTAGCYHWRQIS